MRKIAFILTALTGLTLTARAQISGPATIAAGTSGTWELQNAPVINSYTWSPEGTSQPATSSLTATSVTGGKFGANAAMTVADYPSIWNDNGHWYAFTVSRGVTPNATAALYRLDLGSDPTPSNTATSNTVTTFDLNALGLPAGRASHGGDGTGELVHTMVFDPDTKEWHLFWFRTGYNTGTTATAVNNLIRISRLDFGTSLANTPATATAITVPTTSDYTNNGLKINSQVAQSKFVRTESGEYILFIGTRWPDGIVRVNFGKNITNKTPKFDALPAIVTAGTGIGAAVSRASALEVAQQDGKWYLFCSTTDASGTSGNELWRFDLGADLTSQPTAITGLGSLPGSNHWGLQIIPSVCGKEYYGFINGRGTIYRLDFKGDLTSVPVTTQIGTPGSSGLPAAADNSGFFAYPFKDSLYAVIGGANNNGLYSLRLPYSYNGSAPVHKMPGDNTFTYTYNTPGTYDLTAVVNLAGGGAAVYCYKVTVTAAPAQPGLYTAAKPRVCVGETNVTYAVPTVSGATSYEWSYTGTGGATITAATTTGPTNTLSFAGPAGSGTLSVKAVNAAGSSSSRDTSITVNALPTATSTNTGSKSVCTGDSLLLSATTASGVSYQWKNGTTNVGTNSTYYAKTAGSYTVTVTNTTTNCAATSTPPTVLSLDPLPTAAVTPTGTRAICQGDSLQLSATTASGVSYQWKNGTTNVGTNSTYYAKTGGDYTVTVTNTGTSCRATSAITTVNINTLPTVTVSPTGNQAICQGDSLQFVATSGSGVSYEWKLGTTTVGSNSATYYASLPGSYTVKVTNTTTNCAVTSTPATTLSVNSLPAATVSVGGPAIVCAGDSVVLTAGTGTGYSYQWKDGTTNVSTGGNVYAAHTTGSYKVVVTVSGTGCKDSTSAVPVVVHNRPVVTLGPGDTSFCAGGVVTLEVQTQDTGLTYRWKNGMATIALATAYFLEINETGVYTVVVGRAQVGNCEDSTNAVTVTVHPLPTADITWDEAVLHATPGHASYQWQTGVQPIAGATDSTFRPSSVGAYSVTVSDSNGCVNTSAVYNVTRINNNAVADIHQWAEQVILYPNPAAGTLYVAGPFDVQVRLMDATGRTVLLSAPAARTLDIHALAPGIYMAVITGKDGQRKTEQLCIRE